MMIPAPLEGEWLWMEELQAWIPLLKNDNGIPQLLEPQTTRTMSPQ